jgi:peptidyl-prolyl cis-trans isomerase SurA
MNYAQRWCAVLIVVMAMGAPAAWAASVGIAAVVGDDVITTTDVAARRALILATAGVEPTEENQKKITPRIVQSLIDETLQLQEAKRQSLVVTDEELSKAIDALAARGNDKQNIREFVKARGLSMDSLASQMRAQLAWTKVVQRKLRRNVVVTQEEVQRAQKAEASAAESQIRIQALEVTIPNEEQEAALSTLAESMAGDLKAGAQMSDIAIRYVKQPHVKFSQPTWVPEQNLPPVLQQALRNVKPGEYTPPMRAGNVIQILQVMERKATAKLDDATEYAIKQLVIDVPKTRDKASLAKLSAVAATLQADYGGCERETIPNVELPAKANFTRLRVGEMSQQQRSILSNLDVGDVSEPLMGPDALRLVVVCEKTEPSAGSLPDAEVIRKKLFADKIELEAQKHLRNLRRDAYIDVKGTNE